MTLQPIGRCNRWGNQGWKSVITLIAYDENDENYRGEISAVQNIFYTKELRRLWVNFLTQNAKPEMTLEEIYQIYNDFYEKYAREHEAYYQEQMEIALGKLITFSPRLTPDLKNPVSGKTLRNPNGSYYFTIRYLGGNGRVTNRWLSPEDVMSEDMKFYDKRGTSDNIAIIYKNRSVLARELEASGYTELGHFGKKRKILESKDWKRMARSPSTPLPDFTRVYHPSKGKIEYL
jgi:hypothetical protein